MRNWFSNLNGFRGSEVLIRIRRGNIVSQFLSKIAFEVTWKDGWREGKSSEEKVDTIIGQFRGHKKFKTMKWPIPSNWER